MNIQPDPRLDERFYQVLRDTRPALLDTIQALIDSGVQPRAVGEQVQRIAGPASSLPGLCEASARHLLRTGTRWRQSKALN